MGATEHGSSSPSPAYRGRVAITGAAGLLGRAVIDACTRRGWETCAIVRSNAPAGAVSSVQADLSAEGIRLQARMPSPPDAIIHLAAAVPHAAEFPDTAVTAELTRRIDRCVYAAAADWSIPVIYASSCGLYDRIDPSWKTEETPLRSASPYFEAKQDGEALFLTLPQTAVMRLSALYGPGLRRHLVLARFITLARTGQALSVWGSGQREQDFLHAADAANFILAALDAAAKGIYNIASGQPVTMMQLASLVTQILGGVVNREAKPDPLECETARYDIAKAKRDLGWFPTINIEKGIVMLAGEVFGA